MKNIYASTLLVFLLLCGLTATAQTHPKPYAPSRAFNLFPPRSNSV